MKSIPRPLAMGRVLPLGLEFAALTLLDALMAFRHDLVLGKVTVAGGEAVESIATYRSEQPLRVYGDHLARSYHCDACGILRYSPLGEQHVFRSDLRGLDVYKGEFSGIVMTKPVFDAINLKQWKGVAIRRLPIRDEPQGGDRR
ncbi:MAG TPA: hypothetical protein P5081_04865 [Phycisphaerae bacterium]|nr:hypothetical protein [Phycisphaerae bacterium]HRW52195.1 hypothetical protein [Phycisphaerae bacterium]